MERKSSRLLWMVCFGAFVGATLAGWLAPKMISWYFNPPVEMGAFNCRAPIDWSLHKMQLAQVVGFGVGAVVGVLSYFMFFRHRPANDPMIP